MNERLRQIALTALSDEVLKAQRNFNVGEAAEKIVAALERAGVTLPPEPEIPIPDAALDAGREALGSDWIQITQQHRDLDRRFLRAAYPHIVAAVIDALPDKVYPNVPTKYKAIGLAYEWDAAALHRAMRSAKV